MLEQDQCGTVQKCADSDKQRVPKTVEEEHLLESVGPGPDKIGQRPQTFKNKQL